MMIKFKTPLKYEYCDLEPHMSCKSVQTHYEKHYMGYVKNLSTLVNGTSFEDISLVDIVKRCDPNVNVPLSANQDNVIYNNAAQIINHDLFFEQLTWESTTPKNSAFNDLLDKHFNPRTKLTDAMRDSVMKVFGSGWVWLTIDNQFGAPNLQINTTPNGDTIINGVSAPFSIHPLIIIDVWEHAYYVDNLADRASYFKDVWAALDWRVIEQRFERAVVDFS